MVVGAGGGAGWGSRRVSGAGVATRGVALAAELSVQTLSWGGAGPVNIRGAVRGGVCTSCHPEPRVWRGGSQVPGHRAVQPEPEASAWGRGGGDAGVRGGRTRSRTLGHVDGTSEEPGPGGGARTREGAEPGRARRGHYCARLILAGSSGSVYFFNVFNWYFSCLNWCVIN